MKRDQRVVFTVAGIRSLPCHYMTAVLRQTLPAFGRAPVEPIFVEPENLEYPYSLAHHCLQKASDSPEYAIQVLNDWQKHEIQVGYYLQFYDDPTGDRFKGLHTHTELTYAILSERLRMNADALWDDFDWLLEFKRIQEDYRADTNRLANYESHVRKLEFAAKKCDHKDSMRLLRRGESYIKAQAAKWKDLPPLLNVTPKKATSNRKVSIFYSYSHLDEDLRNELEKHLKAMQRGGKIEQWHDRRICAGDEWKGAIDEHLRTADLVLLLISSDFLASDYCYDIEMTEALRRHDTGECKVVPIFLRPVDWDGCPFVKLQGLPIDAKSVTLWPNQDEAFANVAKGIRSAVTDILLDRGRQ